MNTKLADGTIRLVSITNRNLHRYGYVGMGDYLYKGLTVESIQKKHATIMAHLADEDILDVESFQKDGTTIRFGYHTDKNKIIELPLCFYPGYEANTENGQALEIMENEHYGLLVVLPAGDGTVHLRYTGMPIFHIVDGISFSTLVLCIAAIGRKRLKSKRRQLD
jgi:uncharacterized membrane protein YfhO